ncbi:MAG: LysM domain-containing protein [Thiotrichales bacterium]
MTDALKTFLQSVALEAPAFPPTSRYHGLATTIWTAPDGRELPYVTRRFIPPPEQYATLQTHRVAEGDRLDTVAAQYLGDPEQYWRVCDATPTLQPEGLVATPGARLRITLPEGVPGAADAD